MATMMMDNGKEDSMMSSRQRPILLVNRSRSSSSSSSSSDEISRTRRVNSNTSTTTTSPAGRAIQRQERRRCACASSSLISSAANMGGLLLMLLLAMIFSSLAAIVSANWIDPDTPINKRATKSFVDKTTYHLVMSDEFDVPNRSFKDGHDPVWTALDKSDDDASSAGGGSMQFYNSSTVTTRDGYMAIDTILQRTEWNRYDHVKKTWKHQVTNFTSGMVQSWNKFCFTGGIVEVDVIFPGEPFIGGLWPAVWMLGNLGRATYEASTNNLWPWSYNTCNRKLQQAQTISACNRENHYGMHPFQGRGATEIDIVEVMTGDSNGPLPGTKPPVALPYADLTLQVAPGVKNNRPQSGSAPVRKKTLSKTGHTEFAAQTWYEGLQMSGNTSINPFFYGTYLDETKPYEPVTRTKEQAFQADAIGAAHQLTPAHFQKAHTFRVEWQPGKGGRLDWFVKGQRLDGTLYITGDDGDDWIHAYELQDTVLRSLMGSQIPNEPSSLIMNTAISSTWGFPFDTPEWCAKCFDCDDPKCACSFYPGFCEMVRAGNTTLLIDSIRVYQSTNASAHVGSNHTLGCDPIDYPTHEWITGHEYRYMRNPPFVYADHHPMRAIKKGGGSCSNDTDCGGDVITTNWTAAYEDLISNTGKAEDESTHVIGARGKCVSGGMMSSGGRMVTSKIMTGRMGSGKVCKCNPGFTGPHCLALDYKDETDKAREVLGKHSPFRRIESFAVPFFLLLAIVFMGSALILFLMTQVVAEKREKKVTASSSQMQKLLIPTPVTRPSPHLVLEGDGGFDGEKLPLITGKSI